MLDEAEDLPEDMAWDWINSADETVPLPGHEDDVLEKDKVDEYKELLLKTMINEYKEGKVC